MNFFFPPDFHFQNPLYVLLFLLLIPIGYFFYIAALLKQRSDKVFHQQFFNQKKEILKFVFLTIAFAGFVLSLMNPVGYRHQDQSPLASVQGLKSPLPVLFLLDTSLSMSTPDASFRKPRFEEAKEIISALLPKLSSTSKAFYTFDDHLQKIIPVTLDSTYIGFTLDALQPSVSQEGTNLLQTFEELKQALETKDAIKPRQIILITDGEETGNESNAKLLQIGAGLASLGITLNVIGVGSKEGAPIPHITYQNAPVVSHLSKELLVDLARQGGGRYYNALDLSIQEITDSIVSNIEANTYATLQDTHPMEAYVSLFPLFLIVALLFFQTRFF